MAISKLMDVAGSGMNAQLVRMNATASNIANAGVVAESPELAYRAKRVVFEATLNDAMSRQDSLDGGVKVSEVIEDTRPARQIFDPGNPLANDQGYVWASNVNQVAEMIDMLDASRAYQNSVEVATTAKDLMLRTLEVIRV
jgi:flagellar basal-body rod protein FlgC